MSEVRAPYNFAPVSETVLRDWAISKVDRIPSQDIPYRDGLCGEVELTIEAETPLLISGTTKKGQDAPKTFALGTDGVTPEIPGSSLKGMVRSVLEIASFSALNLIEDRRFGLRDLSGPSADSYRRKFDLFGTDVPIPGKASRTQRTSFGGWLRRGREDEEAAWVIEPCKVGRVRYEELFRMSDRFERDFKRLREMPKIDAKQAPQVYALWSKANGGLSEKRLAYHGGTLVFTGIPSYNKRNTRRNKKGEFVFTSSGEPPIRVPDDIWSGFIDVHEHQEKPSSIWLWWKKRLGLAPWDSEDKDLPQERAHRIPVFYLHDGNEIKGLGLAQMFKFAGAKSTRNALPEAHVQEVGDPDLTERIFGRVHNQPSESFKGRASFSAGRMIDPSAWKIFDCGDTVAAAPKPGFHPAYIRQNAPAANGGRNYVTWADTDVRIRGWKRYPAKSRTDYSAPPPPPRAGAKSVSKLQPIVSKNENPLCFTSKLRVHNLRPFELGALLWAISWGDNPELRHALGMGKPYGWGRVKITIGATRLLRNDNGTPPSIPDCQSAFESLMEEKLPGWLTRPTIVALLGMATPKPAEEPPYMLLEVAGSNEFRDALRQGSALPFPEGVVDWHQETVRPEAAAQQQTTHQKQPLFKANDNVRDIENGDFGVVLEDQPTASDKVLVDFESVEEWMSPEEIERA